VSAPAAITSIRAPFRYVFFPPEMNGTSATGARPAHNFYIIYKIG
jgi:hypothetical protein